MIKIKRKPKTEWLIRACIISLILIGTYITAHIVNQGEEELFLNRDQLSAVNAIIALDTKFTEDSLITDKAAIEKKTQRLVSSYLENVLPYKNSEEIGQLFKTYEIKHLSTVLPTYSFKVKSFFWLTGARLFLEIVFWSLFGLMANLMFSVPIAENFDKKRIPEHIGKIFYTPFSAIIIYLSINALVNGGSIVFDGIGKSVIVLAFILGFFTRRTILLIGKIKDLILPVGKDDQVKNKSVSEIGMNEIRGAIVIDQVSDETKEQNNEYVVVKISGMESDYVSIVNADKNGDFFFSDVPNGNYKIESELVIDETRFYDEDQIQILDNEEPLDINIVIKKSELIIK
jgi:hypothetical protein